MATVTITSEPVQDLQAVYRPLFYRFQVSGSITNELAALSVQVYVNGAVFGAPIPVSPYEVEDLGSFHIHRFELNIAGRVQQFFDMAEFLPTVAKGEATVGSSLQASVHIVVSSYYPDANGVLQLDPTTKTSQAVTVINAFRWSDEDPSLEYYDLFASPAVPSQAKFLTRKPGRVIVADDDTEFLGLYCKGFSSMRVRAYDFEGALIDEGTILLGASSYGAEEVTILPVGPANINAIAPGDWTTGGPVTIDSSVRYYIIQAGLVINGTTFWTLSELRRYYVVPNYCKKHRIHFINSFGCPDSFTIWNSERVEYSVDGETYERALPSNPGLIDPGTLKVQNTGRLSVTSPVGNLTRADQEFLAREFSMSPRIWTEKNGQYIPVFIESGNFDVLNTSETSQELTFSIRHSRRDFSQRN